MQRLFLVWLLPACRPEEPEKSEEETLQTTTPVPDDGFTTPLEALTQSGTIRCDAPEDRSARGAFYEADLGDEWRSQRPRSLPEDATTSPSAGITVVDFTGDGMLDVFLPQDGPCMLFVGQPDGTLRDQSVDRIPHAVSPCFAWSGSPGDADGDGDIDLYITREAMPDELWQNDGTGRFTDVTAEAGLPDLSCGSRSASWGDMDGDGDLDVFVARHRVILRDEPEPCPRDVAVEWSYPPGNPNTLLENRGDGTFVDVSYRLPIPLIYGYSFIGGWLDIDSDGDQDIVMVNDFGMYAAPTTTYINDGEGRFHEISAEAGLTLAIYGMSLAVGDLNADARPDILVSDIDQLHVLTSFAPGLWVDQARSLGVTPDLVGGQHAAWGNALEDINNDGLLDAVVVFGPTEDPLAAGTGDEVFQPDGVYLQQRSGTFVDMARVLGLDQTSVGRGLVVMDYDHNGWLDILRTDYRTGPAKVHLQRCGEEAWTTVALEGPLGGYGARIEVVAGDLVLRRWNNPSSTSLASSGPSQVHFGLDDEEWIDVLRITWADGTVSRFEHLPSRQHLVVRHDDWM